MSKMLKVRILSQGRIPFLGGNGPILRPIFITEDQYKTLSILGYNVELVKDERTIPQVAQSVEETQVVQEEDVTEDTLTDKVEEEVIEDEPQVEDDEKDMIEETQVVQEEDVTEDTLTDKVEEEVIEDDEKDMVEEIEQEEELQETEEELYEEVLVNDESLSGSAYYTHDFLTKKKAITILTNRGVEFDSSQNAEPLKQLVLKTNPDVIFEEE